MGLIASKVPPKYEDIGKEVKDLFEKNYNCGTVKVNAKSSKGVGGSGAKFETETNVCGGQAKGFIELISEFDSNLLIQNKWTSENTFASEVTFLNRLHPGTRFSVLPTFDPKSGKFGGMLAAQYNNEFVSGRCEATFDDCKLVLTPSIIFSSDGWVFGSKFGLDPQTNKLDKKCASFGYQGNNFSGFGILNEKGEMYATLYQRLTEANAEAGFTVQLPCGGNDKTKLEFATAYNFDSLHRIQTKVNTQCQIEVAIAKNIGNGIILSVCGQLDGKNIKSGAHKAGLGVDMSI